MNLLITRHLSLVTLFILIFLTACTSFSSTSPTTLYIYDVRSLHLNHHALCGGPCTPETPPPAGKSHPQLLQDYDQLIFLSSLQGIVNQQRPQLYLIHHETDQFWLDIYQTPNQPYGWLSETDIVPLADFDAVVATFTTEVDGLVEWDDAVPATLNVATTMAGVEGWPIVRNGSALRSELTNRWPIKHTLVNQFNDDVAAYQWAIDQYLNTGRANYTLLGYLEDGWPATRYKQGLLTRGGVYALERDYLIQQGGFAFDLSPWADEAPEQAEMMAQILQAARREAGLELIKLWGFIPWYEKYAAAPGFGGQHHPVEGEWESTWLFSYYAAYLQGGGGDAWGVAMANVSVHRYGPKPKAVANPPALPTPTELQAKGYLLADGTVNPEITFLLFYLGDYDLVHPTQVAWANWERTTWVEAGRGQIPLAWGINPGMEEEIPAIMSYMLATRTDQDYLVASNSGAGYLNPQAVSRRYRQQWLNRSADFYHRYGITIQGFLLNGRGHDLPLEWVNRFTTIAPDGIIAPDFEIVTPWPVLVNETPFTGMARETVGDHIQGSANVIHQVYQRNLAHQRPPFLAIRSSFQKPEFLHHVYNQMQADDTDNRIIAENGDVLHPNYELVDPYTFFALLKIWLKTKWLEYPVE